jgi:4-aminobutyrate--pyruvate transaminase
LRDFISRPLFYFWSFLPLQNDWLWVESSADTKVGIFPVGFSPGLISELRTVFGFISVTRYRRYWPIAALQKEWLSKQLSSSYQPIAAILINDAVYQDIADQSHSIGTLGHGFTGSGHPLATAVALENLTIIEEEGLVQHAAEMGIILRKGLQQFADHPMVGEVRGVGLIAAVELVADRHTKEPFQAVGRLGRYLSSQTQERGMINRVMGDALAFCPPLISTEKDINEILGVFAASLDATQHWYLEHTAQ